MVRHFTRDGKILRCPEVAMQSFLRGVDFYYTLLTHRLPRTACAQAVLLVSVQPFEHVLPTILPLDSTVIEIRNLQTHPFTDDTT